MEVKAVERTSRQSGKKYIALEIIFPCGYKKLVFLDKSEEFLLLSDYTIEEE